MSHTITPIEVFFSYSHRDESFKDALIEHLSLLRRQETITAWHDRQIGPGTEWDEQINDHLNHAQVILLLISASFLNSTYCYSKEMMRALERHEARDARVIPIIVRPCDWAGAPFSKLQAVPTDARAVTSWTNQDEAWTNVAQGIRRAVEDIQRTDAPGPAGSLAGQARPGGHEPEAGAPAPIPQDMTSLTHDLLALEPTIDPAASEAWDEQLVSALAKTQPLAADFARRVRSIAARDDREAAKALFKGFEQLLQQATFSIPVRQSVHDGDSDFLYFLTHELFTVLIAGCMTNERWEMITEILTQRLYLRHSRQGDPRLEWFTALNSPVGWGGGSKKRLQRNAHALLLRERHESSPLAEASPFGAFMDADYFLFLRAQVRDADDEQDITWVPWSSLCMGEIPRYLIQAEDRRYAETLARALGLTDADSIADRIKMCRPLLPLFYRLARRFPNPVNQLDLSRIASS